MKLEDGKSIKLETPAGIIYILFVEKSQNGNRNVLRINSDISDTLVINPVACNTIELNLKNDMCGHKENRRNK